jgi:TM2 domain-containing membrane protein YozV
MSSPASPTSVAEVSIRCPYCAEVILASAKKCKHCGEFLDSTLRQPQLPNVTRQKQTWNPGIAAVLSLVIPGAGQMYKGQVGAGIWWLVGTIVGYCAFIVPGVVVHIICIYKAYSDDPSQSQEGRPRPK